MLRCNSYPALVRNQFQTRIETEGIGVFLDKTRNDRVFIVRILGTALRLKIDNLLPAPHHVVAKDHHEIMFPGQAQGAEHRFLLGRKHREAAGFNTLFDQIGITPRVAIGRR